LVRSQVLYPTELQPHTKRHIHRKGGEIKEPSVKKALEKVARLAGFEPTTPWFVAKYSIQLSYSRTQKRNYSKLLKKGKRWQQFLAAQRATGRKIGKKPCRIVASGVAFALERIHSGCADRVRLLIQ
jgi:hypothetical protein